MHASPRRKWILIGLGGTLLIAIGLATVSYPQPPPVNTRSSSTTMKTIASAQAWFRAEDADGDGVKDFWRGDIAGLYALKDKAAPLKLIELSLALADDRPITDLSSYGRRAPKAGYWYRAIRHATEQKPDPQRFAACAFPAETSGRWMYVIDELNTIWRKEYKGEPPAYFPADPNAEGWSKMD